MTNNISRTKESIQNILIFFTDAIAIVLSYYIAGIICLHFYWGIDGKQIFAELSDDFISIMVATVITAIFYNVRNDFVSRGYFEEFKSVVCKCAAFAAVMAVYELLRRDVKIIPRGTYIATIFIAVVIMYISRVLVKLYLRSRNESKKATRVIMVSVRNRAQTTLSNIDEKDDWLRRIDGIVIMDEDMTGEKINGVPVVANIHTMMKYIKNEIVDENKDQDELDTMQAMNKNMTYMMPIMSVMIAFIAPLGLALYWFISNLLMIVERVIINKIMEHKEEEENA